MAENKAAAGGARPDGDREGGYLGLLERNRRRIDRISRAWARTRVEREDLRSEICLQLWRSFPAFDRRSAEDTWLYRVALNTAMLFRRGDRRVRVLEQRAAVETPPRIDPGPDANLERRQRVEALLRAIAELDPTDRALITLRLEELPLSQIAEITGIREGTVGVRLHRCRRRLVKLLGAEDPRA